ncbi:hypothetical protein ABTH30_21465, partial [Acinetobacter baumannii]
ANMKAKRKDINTNESICFNKVLFTKPPQEITNRIICVVINPHKASVNKLGKKLGLDLVRMEK